MIDVVDALSHLGGFLEGLFGAAPGLSTAATSTASARAATTRVAIPTPAWHQALPQSSVTNEHPKENSPDSLVGAARATFYAHARAPPQCECDLLLPNDHPAHLARIAGL